MKTELINITIRDLVEGYDDKGDEGVVGYEGKLDIRPPYQREFVYKDAQRNAVIDTVLNGFPLNTMYWSVRDDGNYEIIDGQQRTVSICQYVAGIFSIDGLYFHNHQSDIQEKLLDYPLMIYLCSGTDSEKLEWFKRINIAGAELTMQELRNAVYSGSWVSDAKRYFSRNNCVAFHKGGRYMSGSAIRQEYLETVIKWISGDEGKIEEYMGRHQHDEEAVELWEYFQDVIDWVEGVFSNYRKEMKGVDWGGLFNVYGKKKYDAAEVEQEVAALMMDDDVSNKKGIYLYVFTRAEKYLNIRSFSERQKREAYERQKGVCSVCGEEFKENEMEADHITPWHEGGKTVAENCQMLCRECNRRKSGR